MRVAAIDVGTNTVRLLAADVDGKRIETIARDRAITRLGQGVDADRRLHPDAIARTLDAIETFVVRATDVHVEKIRVAGTSVLRDAVDRDEFVACVLTDIGVPMDVLSGTEEGRIAYLGATLGLPEQPYVVCDIGGGSTELSTSAGAVSLDIGSVRLKERCLRGDPPTFHEIEVARTLIGETLSEVEEPASVGKLVGVAGTITTLAAVILGLRTYDRDRVHHSVLSIAEVSDASDHLLSRTAEDIVAIGPVEPGRADVIGGGSLILRCVMQRFGFDEVLVSESDILEGLVLDLVR